MSKNIIICSDGTGNSGGLGSVTNVWRIFEAVKRDDENQNQIAFYDDGVGTESFKPLRLLGGAFGLGLARNVRQLYAEICGAYEPGDRIYYFGFSRGAFTVRTLLGWIMKAGLIDPSHCADRSELDRLVKISYKALRTEFKTIPQKKMTPDNSLALAGYQKQLHGKLFNLDSEQQASLAHFIGVWDTVDAVGFPVDIVASFWNNWIHQFKFPDHLLNEKVRNAYHALAIDDERRTFHPQPWDELNVKETQNLHQVWFSGMHANVGGGYPQDGMAMVSLVWIMNAAIEAGVKFTAGLETLYRDRANKMEKMYDSRSGLGVYYRFAPRNLEKLRNKYNLRELYLHPSVVERIKQAPQGYTPRHVPKQFKVWAAKEPDNSDASVLCEQVNLCLKKQGLSDVEEVGKLWDRIRSYLQLFFVIFTISFVIGASSANFFPNNEYLSLIGKVISLTDQKVDWTKLTIQAGVLTFVTFILAALAERYGKTARSRFWKKVLVQLNSKH
ncbi:MAG: DUF2235 domain-containing protein [Arenicella sp.]